MTARIRDFDSEAPRDYENGCPVCGRTDVVTDRKHKGDRLVLGHTCYPPFAEEPAAAIDDQEG